MIEHRNIKGETGSAAGSGSRYREIASPKRGDGLGLALDSAFMPTDSDADFNALLRELDRKTERPS